MVSTNTTSPAVLDSSLDFEPSCFEILNVLRSRLFLARTKLVEKIEIAQLDEEPDSVSWVEFSPSYHSHLVKCTLSLLPRLAPSAIPMAKRAMFVYILEVLNREDDDIFRLLQHGKSQDNRVQREKNRLARKRERAAKREREREAAKRIVPPTGSTVVSTPDGKKCASCGRLFNSRKRYSKHACVRKEKKQNILQSPSDSSESESRASTPTNTYSTVEPSVTGTSGDSGPLDLETQLSEQLFTVEGSLGEYLRWVFETHKWDKFLVCEGRYGTSCDKVAHGVIIHGNHETSSYLKCEDCGAGRFELQPFPQFLLDALVKQRGDADPVL
ncbi:hypothetical protein J3R82DRAFT_5309 [Butyriboletus roseoflavus]|nr:hypothetical protein J3R82DRAFT_5309 [Butyriboletus roseoflavus]